MEEREFLVDLGVVTETQSNLGLVALSSEDVYQLMYEDYPSKFKEYMSVLEQRSHATSLQQIKEETEALTKKVTMLCFVVHALLNSTMAGRLFSSILISARLLTTVDARPAARKLGRVTDTCSTAAHLIHL